MSLKSFVKDYALSCYTFDGNPEDYFIVKLIHNYVKGKRVLDLGCGPVVRVTSIFYPKAKEIVAVDRLKENLDFVRKNSDDLNEIIERAKMYKYRYLSKKDSNPKIRLVQGDVTKKLSIGKFDSIMQVGCFGALNTTKQFQDAVDNAYSYLKKGGTILMVNWVGNVKRPYNFNGKVNEIELFEPCMKKSGFKIKELHITSKLGKNTRKMGYRKIIWSVAKK